MSSAAAQRLCVGIRPRETAADVATRVTGAALNTRESWFQILDPASSRFVSKSHYDRVQAGWQACIVDEPAMSVSGTIPGFGHDVTLWGLLLVSSLLMIRSVNRFLNRRATVVAHMRQFAERFVYEFEQPLTQSGRVDRPIHSRLRFAPSHARLDVLLAPNAGRRYPNLTDHKHNVEYDVTRVLELLKDQPFVGGRPYAQGRWVVVPFQRKPGIRQAGGT